MNIQPETLGALFEMSRDAVLGIKDGLISFANPATGTLLGIRPGDPASRALPDYILSDPSERFIASFELNGQQAEASIARQEELTLARITLQDENSSASQLPLPVEELGASLMTAKLAIDAIVARTGAEKSLQLKDYTHALYHSYYRIKRAYDHMTAARNIQQGLLPCNAQAEDLEELCYDLCDSVNHLAGEDISIVFRAGPGSFITMLDADQIEIMLLNLLSNSIAHMPSGGTIEMELTRQGERFIISVRDSGSGIDPAKLSGIAPRDLTDTAAGSGLGLYVARGIAQRHGGALILDTTPGQGASVRISLPHRVSNTLKFPTAPYGSKSMTNILTELSPVLDRNSYGRKIRE
ncbi:MAG: ATP-binding protein [Oscillospiraceae bacterium]|nr:ATP-binding protein [Oscillospiraceae bacterium]